MKKRVNTTENKSTLNNINTDKKGAIAMKKIGKIKTRVISMVLSAITVVSVSTMAMGTASAATLESGTSFSQDMKVTMDDDLKMMTDISTSTIFVVLNQCTPYGKFVTPALNVMLGNLIGKEKDPTQAKLDEINGKLDKIYTQIKDSENAVKNYIEAKMSVSSFYNALVKFETITKQMRNDIENIKKKNISNADKLAEIAGLTGKNAKERRTLYRDVLLELNKWIEKPSLTSDKDIFEYTYDHFCNQVMFSGEAIDNAKPVCNYIMSVYATGCTTIMESLAAQLYVNNLSEAIQAEINPRLFNEIALDTDNIDRAIKDISDTLVGTEIYQADDDNNGFENYAGDNDATETYAEKCNKILNKSRTIIVNKGKSNYNTQSGMSSRAVSSLEKPDFDFYGNNYDEMIKLVKNSFNWQIAECQLDFDTVKDIAAYAKSNKMSIRTLLSKAGYDVSGIAKNANLVSSKAWTDKKDRLLKVWCWAYYKGFNVDEVGAEEKTTEFWTLGDGITGKWNSPKGNEVCIFNG